MMRFTDEDFPVAAIHKLVHRRGGPVVCLCDSPEMAAEIAKRLNRDNQVYPEDGISAEATAALREHAERSVEVITRAPPGSR